MNNCILCGGNITPFLDLGDQALANALLNDKNQESIQYPLKLARCQECSHIQLTEKIPPEKLFSHYLWVTGTSKAAKDFSYKLFNEIKKLQPNFKNVLEIASNDGTFLTPFYEDGYKVLGIDPAKNICEIARKNGIDTVCDFFSSESALKIKLDNRSLYDVIIARNVIAHTPNPIDFLKGINTLLSSEGFAYIEFHDAHHILKTNQYDSIYHEHYSYFYLKTFQNAASKEKLYLSNVIPSPISGGALIAVLSKNVSLQNFHNVSLKLKEDEELGLSDFSKWKKFSEKSKDHAQLLNKVVLDSLKQGPVFGYGSSARSNTMLSFSNLSSKNIDFIVDNNSLKQNKYTPGTRIPIKSVNQLPKKNATLILLAWNFAKEIIVDLINKGYDNLNIIKPLPDTPKKFQIKDF